MFCCFTVQWHKIKVREINNSSLYDDCMVIIVSPLKIDVISLGHKDDTYGVFLDLSLAFDLLNNSLLLKKNLVGLFFRKITL